MKGLTIQQRNAIEQNHAFLKDHLQGREVTQDSAAEILLLLCPNAPEERIKSDCERIWLGFMKFSKTYEVCDRQDADTAAKQALQYLTEDMSEQQRKGFFLQSYEYIRMLHENEGFACARDARRPDELAGLTQEQLGDLVVGQIRRTAGIYASEVCGMQEMEGDGGVSASDAENFYLVGLAAYAAGLQGDLPADYQNSPEILGACMAACKALRQEMDAAKEKDKDRAAEIMMEVLKIILAVLAAVAVALLLIHVVLPAAAGAIDAILAAAGPTISGMIMDSVLGTCFLENFAELIPVFGILGGIAAGYGLSEAIDELNE